MHSEREAFEIGEGNDVINIIFNPSSAETLIRQLQHAIRQPDETGNHGLGHKGKFFVGLQGFNIVLP